MFGDSMYIVLGVIIILLLIVTIIYHVDKNKITKELIKIEKENGTLKDNTKKKSKK